jgi:hypothetical protein
LVLVAIDGNTTVLSVIVFSEVAGQSQTLINGFQTRKLGHGLTAKLPKIH